MSELAAANATLQERLEAEDGDKQALLDFVQVCWMGLSGKAESTCCRRMQPQRHILRVPRHSSGA